MTAAIPFLLGSLLLFSCALSAGKNPSDNAPATAQATSGNTIESRFAPPPGFTRQPAAAGSFAAYLRRLPLKPAGARVHYYNGVEKPANVYAAVVDLDVGTRDLQQCADAVMRLRAEWLWGAGRKDEISFRLSDGFRADFRRWRHGERIGIRNGHPYWKLYDTRDDSYASFRAYLDLVFTYAGTLSLSASLKPRPLADLAIGDVFIRGGSPGHAVIVVDVVTNAAGEKRFLLAQSYMPAQDIQVLKNEANADGNPWYSNRFGPVLETPEWDFKATELRTW
ncbi:DUF4846 domain-containing protein [Flaviaesturariibacter aridisoli]|uniref:DUF4846 domain-containing protein n=1 Tax=Flaviaesturariibacter aridisoli TaxID=2545761 RepID=A0A4R4DXA1_9BACT|nr:DUF4846 domain-containing protein [Flaviaesturariibacter aridisoli]TCZ67314.1 hypothetical protein E0486_15835 [Flaviaesturariibacter aridisoli]